MISVLTRFTLYISPIPDENVAVLFQGAFWGMMLGLVLGMVRFGIEFSYTVPPCGSGNVILLSCYDHFHSSFYGVLQSHSDACLLVHRVVVLADVPARPLLAARYIYL